jgi:SPOR domain
MPVRDSQTVVLSRQTILLVTAVGVGLLTLCYVLGVQVGKQSAALRHPAARGAGEDLQELPASVADQLTALESARGADATFQKPAPKPPDPPAEAKAPPPVEVRLPGPVKPEAPKGDPTIRWTLQLISTPDAAEAQRMANKAKAAGFPTVTVLDNGLSKVRLAQPGSRESIDATALKLKNRGFKPFAIKSD